MNHKQAFITLLVLFIFMGCKPEDEKVIDGYKYVIKSEKDLIDLESVKISGEEIVSSDRLHTTGDMLLIDSVLVFQKMVASPDFYELFDLNSKRFVASFGKLGGGPAEFPDFTRSTVIDKGQGVIGVTVPNDGSAYYEIPVNSIFRDNLNSVKRKFDLGTKPNGPFVRLNNKSFAVLRTDSELRITIVDSLGVEIQETVNYPFADELILPKDMFGFAYQANIIKNDRLNRVGIFNTDSPNWDIVEFKGNEVNNVISYHLRPPSVRDDSYQEGNLTSKSVAVSIDNKMSFLSSSGNDKGIYSLFSGRSPDRYGIDCLVSSEVLVFDWNGRVLGKLKLREDVSYIVVSEDNKYLYAYSETLEANKVVRYEIPSSLIY